MLELMLFLVFALISASSVHLVGKINAAKGIKGIDINKANQPSLPESTGIALLIPLALGVGWLYLSGSQVELVAWLALMAVFGVIGFLDDVKHKFLSNARPWVLRALPIALASLAFSYLFSFDLFLVIPLALFIAGLASFQNTFAGLNGWEIGTGFIISVAAIVLLLNTPYALAAIVLSASILGLLTWNIFPAKVFPGDSGTLLIGSGLAGLFVLTQKLELILLFFALFVPHMVDFFLLKLLTNPKDVSQIKMRPYKLLGDSRLAVPEYPGRKARLDFAKLVLKIFGPLKEWQVVLVIWLAVIAYSAAVLFLAGKIPLA